MSISKSKPYTRNFRLILLIEFLVGYISSLTGLSLDHEKFAGMRKRILEDIPDFNFGGTTDGKTQK